jgi:hypothetical protein
MHSQGLLFAFTLGDGAAAFGYSSHPDQRHAAILLHRAGMSTTRLLRPITILYRRLTDTERSLARQ